jgi:hypothetical protein
MTTIHGHNMKSKYLFYLLFIFFFYIHAQGQDRRILADKAVYFFGPSVTEMDSLSEDDSEAIADFNYYTNRVVPYLRLNNLKTEYLSDRIIEIQYDSIKTITVYRDSVDFGTILTDSTNRPKVLKYVFTDDELKKEIKKYFKLK